MNCSFNTVIDRNGKFVCWTDNVIASLFDDIKLEAAWQAAKEISQEEMEKKLNKHLKGLNYNNGPYAFAPL